MNVSEFPAWAPKELVNTYEGIIQTINGGVRDEVTYDIQHMESRANVLKQLLSHEKMESVWRRIKNREEEVPEEELWISGVSYYALTVYSALHDASPWEEIAPAERSKEAKAFMEKARELAEIAGRLKLGKNIVEFFNDTEITGLQMGLDGYGMAADEVATSHLEKLPDPPPLLFVASQFKMAPTLEELLLRIAESVELNPPYQSALISSPGAKSNKRAYFVRRLAQHNTARYGLALKSVIADTTAVFFPDLMSDEKAISAILGKP